ncbi:MAG: type VI secretion system protein TssA, partial [Candidatus Electrothrix sp. AR4]|nr:type VI secretion system protein TssA [Candidatus Electrothrix sp. AR4]
TGFAVGVHVLRNLLETWWDGMYPPKKRKKGRINILNWWDDKLQQLLSEREAETWPAKQRKELLDDLDGIDALIADKLEDGPMLRPLQTAVAQLLNEEVEAPPPPSEPEPVAATEEAGKDAPPDPEEAVVQKQAEPEESEPIAAEPTKQKKSPPKPVPAPVAVVEDGDAAVYLRQGLDLLGRAASHVFQVDTSGMLPYQLNRLVAWSEIDELPPSTDAVTMLPPPDEQIVSMLETMFQAENWQDLLSTAESRVREYLFWLDLSYYSARALSGLGHGLAAQAVENETRLHVLRLPGIESLAFSDALPFASQQTRDWLTAAPVTQGRTSPPETAASGDREQDVAQDVDEAARLCAGSGIQAALAWLAEQKKAAGSPRREFMYDVGFCRLLFQADRTEMALSFAEKLLMLIDLHDLEKWEPELAVRGLIEACRCLRKSGEEEEIIALKRKQIAERLALLAPDQMLTLV